MWLPSDGLLAACDASHVRVMENSESTVNTIPASELQPGDVIVSADRISRVFVEGEVYASSSMPGFTVVEADIASLYFSSDTELEVERD